MKRDVFILLVEDDPDDIDLMREALMANQISYKIETINEGDKVMPYLKVCKKFPDVIILDLNIPKLHGKEVLRQVRTADNLKHIPIAVLTTSSSTAERENCLEIGADIFMTKPSSVDGFNEMVASILNVAVKVSR